jgi:hypothetical protein
MLPVRANANTVINENKPSDATEVLAYYNREQYGVNPLFYGSQYTETFAGLDADKPYLDKALITKEIIKQENILLQIIIKC